MFSSKDCTQLSSPPSSTEKAISRRKHELLFHHSVARTSAASISHHLMSSPSYSIIFQSYSHCSLLLHPTSYLRNSSRETPPHLLLHHSTTTLCFRVNDQVDMTCFRSGRNVEVDTTMIWWSLNLFHMFVERTQR